MKLFRRAPKATPVEYPPQILIGTPRAGDRLWHPLVGEFQFARFDGDDAVTVWGQRASSAECVLIKQCEEWAHLTVLLQLAADDR
jgi:hypothetical protein